MKANILIYVSSATAVPYREGGTQGVGVFLSERTDVLTNTPLLKSFDALFISGGHAPMTGILYKKLAYRSRTQHRDGPIAAARSQSPKTNGSYFLCKNIIS